MASLIGATISKFALSEVLRTLINKTLWAGSTGSRNMLSLIFVCTSRFLLAIDVCKAPHPVRLPTAKIQHAVITDALILDRSIPADFMTQLLSKALGFCFSLASGSRRFS